MGLATLNPPYEMTRACSACAAHRLSFIRRGKGFSPTTFVGRAMNLSAAVTYRVLKSGPPKQRFEA